MSKFHILMGGGDTQVTVNRTGHNTTQLTTEQAKKIIHLNNLPYTCSELKLLQLCQSLGVNAQRIQYPTHTHGPLEGQPKGFAWVECSDETAANFALAQLNKFNLDGSIIVADHFVPSHGDGGKIRGFAHLKKKTRDNNPSGSKFHHHHHHNNNNSSHNIDGVPYDIFVKLVQELDGITADDLNPIFELPAIDDNE